MIVRETLPLGLLGRLNCFDPSTGCSQQQSATHEGRHSLSASSESLSGDQEETRSPDASEDCPSTLFRKAEWRILYGLFQSIAAGSTVFPIWAIDRL